MLLNALHAKQAIAFALHLEVLDRAFIDIDEAARTFGLQPLGDKWRAIDRVTAMRVLFALLIEDMAFSSPRMSEQEARMASEEFLSQFGAGSRFVTNGNWEDGWTRSKHSSTAFGPEWTPATNATFDGGVIVLDRSRSGVLWLEDED
jgi:hypothetical protein